MGSQCHKALDYAGLLKEGSRRLIDRAYRLAEERDGEAKDFSLAFAIGLEGMIAHAMNYSREAFNLSGRCQDPQRKEELIEIARICARVPAEAPNTFHEALQALWFYYMVAGDSPGRVDQFLLSFYERDLEKGILSKAKALELLECLLIKMHDDYMGPDCNVSSVHTLTVGGLSSEGEDATNELTYLFLEAARNVRLLRPSLYIRCHAHSPDRLIRLGVDMLAEGLSEPSFYGDEPIIAGLERVGVSTCEARDYVLGGCTEVVSPGRGNWGAPTGWINLGLLCDEVIRDAADRDIRNATGLWEVFSEHLGQVAEACRDITARFDEQALPDLENSLLMPCCLKNGAAMSRGGAESYYGQWAGVGLPNAADMFFAAQNLCFEKGQSLRALLALVDSGDRQTMAMIRNLPKFGNGMREVDEWASVLLEKVSGELEKRSTPLRKAIFFGHLSGGQSINIDYGLHMGATLDGRRAGQPLADSLAGSHGNSRKGPTALIQSITSLDHSRLQAGNVSTLMLHQEDVRTSEARGQCAALVKCFFAQGGSQLQLNFVDAQTLRLAQQDPEGHRGLTIRIAGYSADFTGVARNIQDEVIARTEGME
ncbi:MAG: hypothetical protein HQL31_06675 [Planctomycetes bacterium]|nr:hypothetical protein [Planctomycetota bacterium]